MKGPGPKVRGACAHTGEREGTARSWDFGGFCKPDVHVEGRVAQWSEAGALEPNAPASALSPREGVKTLQTHHVKRLRACGRASPGHRVRILHTRRGLPPR